MEGNFQEGWYEHNSLGLIKVQEGPKGWVYVCYASNGQRTLSRPKPLDTWTWALAEERDMEE